MEELTPTPPVEEIEEEEAAEEEVPTSTSQALPVQLWSVLVLVAFVLGLGAGYLVWGRQQDARSLAAEQRAREAEQRAATAEAAAARAAGQETAPQEVIRYPVPEDDDYVYGSDSAEITIIEFSDYECPFCKRWHLEVWPQIKEKYGDQVRLVYRDFPLESIHPNATPAAEAANCAGEQDRYYEFNELLFAGGKPLEAATYEAYASQLKLDMEQFNQCVSERRYRDEVQADLAYAAELGVRSTPTFFINGLAVVGAQPFEVFDQIISMEIAGEIPK